MNVALPGSVMVLINMAPFILPSLLGSALVAAAWYMCARKNIFTAQREIVKFNFPVLGDTVKKFVSAKIIRMLTTLLKSSVPAVEALEEVISSQESVIYRAALERIKYRIENGSHLSDAFSKEPYFEKIISRMLLVGEESGQMEELLEGIASVMEEEAQNKIKILISIIEPLSTVFVGIIVGFIVITMMSPMVKILSSLE
jgi:type IV pilus assembly protein PilC